jgi:tetrapyrrole methylase family protein/MazG family protein
VADQVKFKATPTFAALMALIATLRGENGCPWDRKQTQSTLSVYLIEEVFELVEAIAADDTAAICEEMGDVLFQLLFLMHLFQEQGRFAPTDALERIIRKMVHRHPHVFGSDKVDSAAEVKVRWREIKQKEKGRHQGSLMDTVPSGLPALMRSYRVSERAAGIGFDWDSLSGVLAQTEAEWSEFKAELIPQEGVAVDMDNATEEFGDILFTLVNVARLAGIHAETALSKSTQKFVRRFKLMEAMAAEQGRVLKDLPRQEMEALWGIAKARDQREPLDSKNKPA